MRGPASVPTIAMQVVCFSLVTFLLTANAYKFTTVESSLVGSPAYSAYVRMVIRFFNHPYSDFSDSLEEQQIFEDSIAAVCTPSFGGSPHEAIQLTDFTEHDPEGSKGGPGNSFDIDFKIFVKTSEEAKNIKIALVKVRDDINLLETNFTGLYKTRKNKALSSSFKMYAVWGPETLMNESPGRNNGKLVASSTLCAMIGVIIVVSQAFRRYDFDPTLPPTTKESNSKWEYVLEKEGDEEKKE